MRRSVMHLLAGASVAAALAGLVAWLNLRGDDAAVDDTVAAVAPAGTDLVARGAYLALAGNCAGCHTARGGAAYAGGRAIETPFGTVYTSNLTPDRDTGLGAWTAADFRRALHNGRSRDGRLLVPAFPYPSYTIVSRADSDALFAWLQTLPPVRATNRRHGLRFPYDQQAALALWRALFFRPAAFAPEPARPAAWNRGSYLVRGLGHCVACHAGRNALGATTSDIELTGGLIPMQNWYAPSLASPAEAGVAQWQTAEIVALLKTGVSATASVMGPMAEVVFRSTQYLSDDDLAAMAAYLQALPQLQPAPRPRAAPVDADTASLGARLYGEHCAGCHGADGRGRAGAWPALAGNRAVTLVSPNNVVKAVLHGGYAPATAGNPRPYGMPPFAQSLSAGQIAAVATHVRGAWGNDAAPVSSLDVERAR